MGKKKWFTPSDVVVHNKINDIWVTMHGEIYDLTKFIKGYFVGKSDNPVCRAAMCNIQGICSCKAKKEIRLLLAYAGKDVSHWFKHGSKTYKTFMHPVETTEHLYAPHGTWVQHSGVVPSPDWRPAEDPCWVEDRSLVIGHLTRNPRPLNILNTLTGDCISLEVCEEETIFDIIEHRFIPYNRHYSSYIWTYKSKPLVPKKTLTENGILDKRHLYLQLGINEDNHVPTILLCFNDDMTDDYPGPL